MVDFSMPGAPVLKSPTVSGLTAKRKIVHGPDGTPHVVYVDLQTGQELQNLAGYQIVAAGETDLDQLGLSPIVDTEKKETTAEAVKKQTDPRDVIGRGGRADSDSSKSKASASRDPSNNFGYVNKPTGMGFASALPGPFGMAGKAVNTALNMNNTAAVNSARGMMGVPKQSGFENVKSTLKDMKGHVADVKVGPGTYSVGLEALDSRGMTTMTPDEAAKRAAANKTKVELASKDDIAAMERNFDAEFGKTRGIIGGFKATASKFIDSLFTSPEEREQEKAEAHSRSMNSGSAFSPSSDGFASMIGAASGKNATSTPGNPVSGAARSTAGKTGGIGRGSSGRAGEGSSGASNPGTSGHMGAGGGTTSGHGPGIGSA